MLLNIVHVKSYRKFQMEAKLLNFSRKICPSVASNFSSVENCIVDVAAVLRVVAQRQACEVRGSLGYDVLVVIRVTRMQKILSLGKLPSKKACVHNSVL